jgi:hypothetical protein
MECDPAAVAAEVEHVPDQVPPFVSLSEGQTPDANEIPSLADDHVPPPPEDSQFERVVAVSVPEPLKLSMPPEIEREIEKFSREASAQASQLVEE